MSARNIALVVALVGCVFAGCVRNEVSEGAGNVGATQATAEEDVARGAPMEASELAPYFLSGPFAEARERFELEEYAEAVEAFDAALEAGGHDETERRRAQFLLAISALRAEQHTRAEELFTVIAQEDPVFAMYGHALAAQAAHAAGRSEAALEHAGAVLPDALLYAEAQLLIARVKHEAGALDEAIAAYERVLEEGHGGARSANLGLMRARVERGDPPSPLADDLTGFIQAHRGSSAAGEAETLLDTLRPALDEAQRARIEDALRVDPLDAARDLYARHRTQRAIKALSALREETSRSRARERWCEMTYLLGKSHTKLREHTRSSAYYDAVIEHCEGLSYHHKALYNAGKAYWNVDDLDAAIARFDTLRKTYPEHSYADDAHWLLARVLLDAERPDEARAALEAQLKAYPDGDMAGQGHWLLVAQDVRAGRHQAVIDYVDAREGELGEDDLYSLGRMSYFKARALEQIGRRDDALDAFEAVIREHPLSYYALLAMGRLSVLDEARLGALTESLHPGVYAAGEELPELDTQAAPELLRGVELMRLGLVDWAEGELARLAERQPALEPSPHVQAALYHGAGLYTRSHRLAARQLQEDAWYEAPERGIWSLAYPRPWAETVTEQARAQGIDVELAYAIMREESAYNPRIESYTNARGLMQLMMPTARSQAASLDMDPPAERDLFKPAVAIPLGVSYLVKLSQRYNAHPLFTIAGYNAGQGNLGQWLEERGEQPLDLWVEDMPFGQTRHYTKRVSMSYLRYLWLYEPERPWPRFDPALSAAESAGATSE